MTNAPPAAARRTLGVGLISPVHNLNPLEAQDLVSAMVVKSDLRHHVRDPAASS